MEAVKPRSRRRADKPRAKQQETPPSSAEDALLTLSDDDKAGSSTDATTATAARSSAEAAIEEQKEKVAVDDAIAELDAIQDEPEDGEIEQNEDDLLALLTAHVDANAPVEKDAGLLVAEGSEPLGNPHGGGGHGDKNEPVVASDKPAETEVLEVATDTTAVTAAIPSLILTAPMEIMADSWVNAAATTATSAPGIPVASAPEEDVAPSAPVFEEFEDDEAKSSSLDVAPSHPSRRMPRAPPPPRMVMPRAFHEISVSAPPATEPTAPSAPPEIGQEDVDTVAGQSKDAPSALSLSPTTSKKLHRVAEVPKNPDKMQPVARRPVRLGAEQSAESVGVAVRSSFAKSRLAETDAGMHALYPTVPQTTTKKTKTAGRQQSGQEDGKHANTQAAYEQLLKKQHVRVKLEPFVNYEMNLMRAEASQKRQEMKMRRLEANKGELYARVERYLFSEYILHSAASTLDGYKKQIDVLVTKVWTLEKKRLSSSKRCGDNVEIEEQLEFQTAKLENQQLEKLKTHLDKLRQLRTVEASMHTFDRALAYLHVEQYLNSVLQEPQLVAFLNKMSSSCGGSGSIADLDLVPESANFYENFPAGSTLASAVEHLKYCLDVLIFFEKKVTLGEEGLFGRVLQSFYRGELIWHSTHAKMHHSSTGGAGMERKVKCYACGSLNSPMKTNEWCKLCESCDVVLYLPPSSVSTKTNEWFSSVLRFRQSLQKWISTCLQTLLRTKSLNNMPYLLMHVMYLPRIATEERSWVLRFLQFPRAMVRTDGSLRNEWSEDLVDHYLAMLHLVFHPEKLRRMSVLVSSGPAANSASKTTSAVGAVDSKGLVSPEWVLLENPEMLDRYFLSDEDFVAVLNQFPNAFAFEQLFRCTSDVKKCFSRALTLVLELTHSLCAFQEFEKLPTRIAQLLGELLAHAAQLPGSSGRATGVGQDDAVFYPTLFDQLFLTTLHGLMAPDCNRVAWKSLSVFPFGSLSELAKWDVLALLLFNLHSLPVEAKTASGWMQFVGNPSSRDVDTGALARRHLYNLIETDAANAMHLLNAVASLAASCGQGKTSTVGSHTQERDDLVAVAVHELFMAGYTVAPCKEALGQDGERTAGPLSTICLAHPWVLSLLITLLFKYHECAATWIHVFETFPINRWLPTSQDLLNLQEWLLLEDTDAPRSALARFLLDHINWEYDIKQQRLFTDAMLHRQVALMVAEALVLYKTRKERAGDPESAIVLSGGGTPQKLEVSAIAKSIRRALWLDGTVDFEKWCWKLMLKLRFYSPKTQEPLLALIDLRHDRSREALTLRRWFAGASSTRLLSNRKSFPFYASKEREVAQLGRKDGEQLVEKAAKGVGGSTGAPIQQEGRVILTPLRNGKEDEDIDSTVAATAAQSTEPIVAYVICQMTTFVFSDRLDRWEPLLILLKQELFPAAIKVLDNLLPILSRLDKPEHGDVVSASAPPRAPEEGGSDSKASTTSSDDEDESPPSPCAGSASGTEDVTVPDVRGLAGAVDHSLEVCMAAMQALSTDDLLSLLSALHEHSYLNTDEYQRMQEVLNKGYIGGWESTAKTRILSKLRFIRECSRYLHPVVLPALMNECFPMSSPMSLSTSALFHGAMSWISSALGGEGSSGELSAAAASSTTAALSIRNSSLTATTASLALLSGSNEYSSSAKALCSLVERSFEYSVDEAALSESMRFWLKALLQVPFWYENAAFRHVVDVLLRCSMEHYYHTGQCEAVATQGHARQPPCLLFELVSMLEAAFDSFCRRMQRREEDAGNPEQQYLDNEPVAVMSFLPAVASSASLASLFGGAFDAAQYVDGCSYLALWSLLVETRKELPLFLTMGQLLIKYEPKTMKKLEKLKKTEGRLAAELENVASGRELDEMAVPSTEAEGTQRLGSPLAFGHTSLDSLSQYKIYRWCEYCVELPESDPTQVVYWQVLFALYFATTGGAHVFGHHFLDRVDAGNAKRVHLRTNLQVKLRKMVNFCSNQAQVVLTATSSGVGGTGTGGGIGLAAEFKESKYAHFVALSQLYTAMDAWMEENDPNQWLKEEELTGLPRHYEVERLKEVLRLSDALLNASSKAVSWDHLPLWTQLCGFEFTVRRTTPQTAPGSGEETCEGDAGASTHPVAAPLAGMGEEDDFAFVEEASELARRHSSFEGVGGAGDGRLHPLPLVPELCGPAALTHLPSVSVATTPDRCAITPSIPLNKTGLKAVGMKFSENLSVLVALDAELIDHVSQLYLSKARTVTQSQACSEGTNCRGPATFRFEFLEWMMDSRLADAIQSIRAQSERCDLKSMLLTNVTSLLVQQDDEPQHESSDDASSLAPYAVDQFLRLDGDGLMLSLQILLMDQVVRALDMEHQKLQHEQKALESESDEAVKPDTDAVSEKDVESTDGDEDAAVESEESSRTQKLEQQVARLHDKGLEWFHLLTELDTKLSRMVPPLREALWRSIKQLGRSFVCVDERETCSLLQLMLEDPSRINLLSECFFPAAAPSRFVEMFAKLMSASSSSKLSSDEKLTLLRRFDFRVWLQTQGPHASTKLDRDTVLSMILGDVGHQFPADRSLLDANRVVKDKSATEHLDEVLRVYAKVLQLICSMHLEDHVEKVLHALVGVHDDYRFQTTSGSGTDAAMASSSKNDSTCTASTGLAALPRPVDAVMWEALVSIPLETWKTLAFMQIESCVAFLSQHMTSLRWQAGLSTGASGSSAGNGLSGSVQGATRGRDGAANVETASSPQSPVVYWQRLGVLKHLLDLFTICCRVAPEQQQWGLMTTFFEPLLSTLYQPASNTEGSAISAPWSDQDTQSTGTTLCSCFVATCSEYLKARVPGRGGAQGTRALRNGSGEPTSLASSAKLSQIWTFYLSVLVPHAPTHVCKHFHQFLTRLAWEHWCLTLDIMQQMRELVQTEKQQLTAATATAASTPGLSFPGAAVSSSASSLSPYPFVSWLVRDVLCRTTSKSTDEWLATQTESVCSAFLLEFAKLCVELVLDLPHFQSAPGRGRGASTLSTNALPPYFVNFIKQQPAFWAKWKMTTSDLETLLEYTLEALKEPLESRGHAGVRVGNAVMALALFPAAPPVAVMQDAFTRLQLVLRLVGHITTLHHSALPKMASLQRVNLFLKLLFGVFEVNDRGRLDGNSYSSERASWLMVLYGASCTALYEKLDELVQFYRQDGGKKTSDGVIDAGDVTVDAQTGVSEEALTNTLAGVLRLCNLSLVETFFKRSSESASGSAPKSGSNGGSSSSSLPSTALNWTKCGNVVFVEIDSLVRDFASSRKAAALQQRKHRSQQLSSDRSFPSQSDPTGDDSDGSSTLAVGVSASQSPAEAVGTPLGRLLWSFLAFRGGELACLAACGRTLASVHVMSQVAEKSIEKWIIEDRHATWDALALRLQVPELSQDEFEAACLEQGKLLTLAVLFLQQLRRAPVLTETLSLGLLEKLVGWMERARVGGDSVVEMKLLFLAAEVTNFVCKPLAEVLPAAHKKQMLRQLGDLLLALGHARRNNGIMKAIGLGGSLRYSVEFHVATLAAGIFLRVQTRNGAPLRVDERIPFKLTRTTEKHLQALETLLQSKDAFRLGRRAEMLLAFARDPRHSLADQDEFFVSLFSSMYPAHGWLLAKCLP